MTLSVCCTASQNYRPRTLRYHKRDANPYIWKHCLRTQIITNEEQEEEENPNLGSIYYVSVSLPELYMLYLTEQS
jgi:hypothetical protein